MDLKLKGKKVFITGSSKGIGLEIAKKFHSYGSIIAINSRNIESFKNAKINFNEPIEYIKGDKDSIMGLPVKQILNYIEREHN